MTALVILVECQAWLLEGHGLAADCLQRPLLRHMIGAILLLRSTVNARFFDKRETPATRPVCVSNNPWQESVSA
jgi:hypothetical protein